MWRADACCEWSLARVVSLSCCMRERRAESSFFLLRFTLMRRLPLAVGWCVCWDVLVIFSRLGSLDLRSEAPKPMMGSSWGFADRFVSELVFAVCLATPDALTLTSEEPREGPTMFWRVYERLLSLASEPLLAAPACAAVRRIFCVLFRARLPLVFECIVRFSLAFWAITFDAWLPIEGI